MPTPNECPVFNTMGLKQNIVKLLHRIERCTTTHQMYNGNFHMLERVNSHIATS